MATFTKSPRRILGDRDVNISCLTSPSKLAINNTPSRKSASYFGAENGVHEVDLTKVLLKPRMESRIHSPSSGIKRRAACMEDVREGSPRKQIIIGVVDQESEDDVPKATGAKPRVLETSVPRVIIDIPLKEKTESTRQILRRSNSPDSSFDHSQESIMEDSMNSFDDSQDTVVTVPDDLTTAAIPPPPIAQIQAPPPRVVPAEEVRLNAAALKTKLQLAMYRVNTGQETTSFEQLEVSKPSTTPTRQRTPLPCRRPNKTPSPPEQHQQRDITQTSTNSIEYDVICSPDGPVLEVTTPRKNQLNPNIGLPHPGDNYDTFDEQVQTQQEGFPSHESTSSVTVVETQSQESQKSSSRDWNTSSPGVKDQAAEGLANLKRKASEDLLHDHHDNSLSESDVDIHLPHRKQPRTDQGKNDTADLNDAA